MPQTTNMGYEVQTTGSNSGVWGSTLNDNMISYVDVNFAGLTTLSLSSSNVLLTASQARNQMIRCTGALLSSIVISPDSGVLWNGIRCVENVTSGSFTVTLTNSAGSVIIPQSRRALVFLDTTNGLRIIGITGLTGDAIPVGTVMPFYQNAVPATWTIVSSLSDYGLKIVSSAGGVTSGSVAYSTFFGRTATDSHTLTIAEMPAHTHDVTGPNNGDVPQGTGGSNAQDSGHLTRTTTSTGGGGGHTHPLDCRVQTASLVLGTKL